MSEIKTTEYLGYVGVDTITGFKGTATAICFYIVGSAQVELTNGKAESHWFDIGRIVMSKSMMRQRITDPETGDNEWYNVVGKEKQP